MHSADLVGALTVPQDDASRWYPNMGQYDQCRTLYRTQAGHQEGDPQKGAPMGPVHMGSYRALTHAMAAVGRCQALSRARGTCRERSTGRHQPYAESLPAATTVQSTEHNGVMAAFLSRHAVEDVGVSRGPQGAGTSQDVVEDNSTAPTASVRL